MLLTWEKRKNTLLCVLMMQSVLSEKTIILTIHQYYYSLNRRLKRCFYGFNIKNNAVWLVYFLNDISRLNVYTVNRVSQQEPFV